MKTHHRLKPPTTCGACEFFSQITEDLKTRSDFCEHFLAPQFSWMYACTWRASAATDAVQASMIKISERLTQPKKRKVRHADPRQDNLL